MLIVVLGITCVGFLTTLAGRKNVPAADMVLSLFGISTLIGLAMLFMRGNPVYTPGVTGIALVAGLGGGLAYFLFNEAVKTGHYGFSNAIYRSSYLVAVVVSVTVFNQPLSGPKLAGIILTTVSIFFISYSNNSFTRSPSGTGSIKWFRIILLAFFLSSLPRIAQKAVQSLKEDELVYLFLSYIPAAVLFLGVVLKKKSFDSRALIYGGAGAAGSYISVYSTIQALKLLGGPVVFPVTLTGPIILGLALSVFFFREKIKPLGYAGIAVGSAGIILLSAFN